MLEEQASEFKADNNNFYKLDRTMRQEAFLYISHFRKSKIINSVYSNLSPDYTQFVQARNKYIDQVKNYQYTILKAIEVLVIAKFDKYLQLTISNSTEVHTTIITHFEQLFSAENFFNVQTFINRYLDYDNSLELGQYYIKSKLLYLLYYIVMFFTLYAYKIYYYTYLSFTIILI